MLMHQIDIQDKIPFEIIDKTNNLQQAIENIENGVGLSKVYDSTDEMYKDLGICSFHDHMLTGDYVRLYTFVNMKKY